MTSPPEPPRTWHTILRPRAPWWDLRLGELWRYRDLVTLFVRRDIVAQFKQTVLGPAWFVLQPILTTLVFTVVFGTFAGMSTDGLPHLLFYLGNNVVWMYFANVLTATSSTFLSNVHLFGKVYFPRLTVPVAVALSHGLKFLLQAALFAVVLVVYVARGAAVSVTPVALLAPVLLVLLLALSLGLGLLVSAMTTTYRDLRFLLEFGVRLLMFTAPVAYPLSAIPDEWRWFLLLNPMTPILEAFRLGFLGQGTLSWGLLAYSAAFAAAAFVGGLLLFHRVERTFMDRV